MNFRDNFIIFGRWDKVSKSGTVPDNPRRMACMLYAGLAFYYFFSESHGLGAYEKTESHVTLMESHGIFNLEREKEQKFKSFNFSYICIIYM